MGFKERGERLYEKLYDNVRRISAQQRRIKEFKKKTSKGVLSAEQVAQVKAFYAPYKKPNLVFHRYFTEKTGVFSPEYLPQDLYVGYIDPYLNDIRAAKYLDNKCYYGALFHSIPQPKLIAKRVNGIWLNDEDEVLASEDLAQVLNDERNGFFVKESQVSAGGFGVTFVASSGNAAEKTLEIASKFNTDITVQRGIVQHADLAKINESSVNSLRIYSVLGKDGKVKIYSAVLRMGLGGSKVDNYASGGISCGITEDGRLRQYAYNKIGEKMETHPTSGLTLQGYVIPSYDRAVRMVHKAHPMIPHFRSVSWDIAIDLEGNPLLIEANLCRGGIDLLQLNNGPLFGEDTTKILKEVFGR